MADTDKQYYRKEDIEWAIPPMDCDFGVGITKPVDGAIPVSREVAFSKDN